MYAPKVRCSANATPDTMMMTTTMLMVMIMMVMMTMMTMLS